jgi:uncharacterized protein
MEPVGTGASDANHADGSAAPVVTDNTASSRFELHVDGDLAGYVTYRLRGDVIDLLHTQVDPGYQGGGLASLLAQSVLDNARQRSLTVLPTCPYIRSWLRKHPSYLDLVPEERRPAQAP